MLALLVAVATATTAIPSSTDRITESQLRAFRTISEIAKETCGLSPARGQNFHADGGAGAALNIDKLKQVLGSAHVSIGGDLASTRWNGPLQRDIGAALISRTSCVQMSFNAMVLRVPLIDMTTGRTIPKPPNLTRAYRKAADSSPRREPETASGNTNTGGQQIAAMAPSTNIEISGPSGNGSTITQNNYLTPVTADQKQQAREALLTDLGELARYPERGPATPGPAIIQTHFRSKAPRALYLLLARYNFNTIESVDGGTNLNQFEAQYYEFETHAPAFEERALQRIGSLVPQHTPYAWATFYHYCISRAAAFTPEQVSSINGEMNFGISPDSAETLYQKIKLDPEIGPGLISEVAMINAFTNLTVALLRPFTAK